MKKKAEIHLKPEEKLASNTESVVSAVLETNNKLAEVNNSVKHLTQVSQDKSVDMDGFSGVIKSIQKNTRKLDEVKSANLATNIALKKIEGKESPTEIKVHIVGAELIKIKGDKGDAPSNEDLLSLIRPLIPKVTQPADGDTPTEEELLALIRPLIPEVKDGENPSDEKLLALIQPLIPTVEPGYTPIKGKDYFDGQDGSPDTPDEVIEKINSSKKKIRAKQIEGLLALIENVYDRQMTQVGVGGGGYGQSNFVDDEIVSGSGTSWTLAYLPVGGIKLYGLGQKLKLTTDYTRNGSTITTVSSWSLGDLVADYRKNL